MKKLYAMTLAAALIASPALAIDFKAPITQIDGKPFTDEAGKPIITTLGTVTQTALLATYPDDAQATGDQKVTRYRIAMKVSDGKADLTAEEIGLVKNLIAKAYGPLIVGRAWQLLDPASVPK